MTLAERIDQINAKTQAWIDEDPENRWDGMLMTDVDRWYDTYGISTADQLDKYLLTEDYSSLYKSVHGIRPRWKNLHKMTLEELRVEFESLCEKANSLKNLKYKVLVVRFFGKNN